MSAEGDPAPARLPRAASGLRHLRWGREVLATLEAHAEHNPRLSAPARVEVRGHAAALQRDLDALSAAVKAYRDFLERVRVKHRGRARLAALLLREEPPPGEDIDVRALAADFEAERARMEAAARRPLKQAVMDRKAELRERLEAMNARLAAQISAAFVESLYPALARGGLCVADDGDEDDDSAAAP
ncbi:MAG: hypothetical protein IT372_23140 [Polyangiaceae bacterium]|nr:hypothetical protein [Polyangiaceae bacterium]